MTLYGVIAPVSLLLTWLVVYKGSSIARWAYVILMSARIGATTVAYVVLRQMPALSSPLVSVLPLLAAASLWFLFRPDARRWFRKDWSLVDPEIFR